MSGIGSRADVSGRHPNIRFWLLADIWHSQNDGSITHESGHILHNAKESVSDPNVWTDRVLQELI